MSEPYLTRHAVFDRHLGVFGYKIVVRPADEELLLGETGGFAPFLQGKKAFLGR